LQRAGKVGAPEFGAKRRFDAYAPPEALKESNFWDALKEMIKSITVGTALHQASRLKVRWTSFRRFWQENCCILTGSSGNAIKYAHAGKFGTH